jgi:hypothetical protein
MEYPASMQRILADAKKKLLLINMMPGVPANQIAPIS